MKKLLTIFLIVFTNSSFSQLLVENFNFSGLLSSNGWSVHSGTTNFLSTTTGLTYTGYVGSGIGNAVLVGNAGGEDVNRDFTAQSGDGTTIYYSFLVNVNESVSNKTGDYFIHIGNRTSPTSFTQFSARVFVRIVSDNINFGLSNTTTATYGSTNFAKNTTYLLVVKYIINTSGNDNVSLWVFNSGVPASELLAGSPEISNTTTSGQDNINAIGIRQGSSTTQPQVIVDGIRIANSWSDAPLPVELFSFRAKLVNKNIQLNWQTQTEVNNYGFEIERSFISNSSNQYNWEKIGFVAGNGNSNSPKEYSFIDNTLTKSGKYAYRLKQIDTDGSYEYSKEVEVDYVIVDKFSLEQNYPNPFNPSTVIRYQIPVDGRVSLKVYDVLGKEIATLVDEYKEAGRYEVEFNVGQTISLSFLSSGMYFYKLQVEDYVEVKKMILAK
jgi:hypothetical protein